MPTAFVLVNTEIGSERDVLRELAAVESITEVSLVYGAYDIILQVACATMDELKRTVTWKIRKLDNITSTQTVIVI